MINKESGKSFHSILYIMIGCLCQSFVMGAQEVPDSIQADSLQTEKPLNVALLDSLGNSEVDRYLHLTDSDFKIVADELDIEVATIKAVVEIEAGKAMRGFWAPGVPVVNFDNTMFQKYRSRAQSKEGDKTAKVPEGLTGHPLKAWTRLVNARKINSQGADLGTFWGMFQIGGFNYQKCGCGSIEEFVKRMSYSELEQLQLFAVFISTTGMVEFLKNKDWRGFARKYNGPSYAKRAYHTKMANAYRRYSAQQEN